MVQATFINESEASKPKRSDARRDGRMKEYDEFVVQVMNSAPGSVAKVKPEAGTSVRAERLRIAQAITRFTKANPNGKGLAAWTGPEGHVYVQYKPVTDSTNGTEPTNETAETAATESTETPVPETAPAPRRRAS